jgi:hypothetical protein
MNENQLNNQVPELANTIDKPTETETLAKKEEKIKQIIESAENGATADFIRSLDLSNQEDVNKLREILEPWDKYYQEISQTKCKILDSEGKEVFPFNSHSGTPGEYFLGGWPLKVENFLEQIKSGVILKDRLSINGHGFGKVDQYLRNLFSGHIQTTTEYSNHNVFLKIFLDSTTFASDSLNDAKAGMFLSELAEINDNKATISSNEQIIGHPNYPTLMKLVVAHEKFLILWNRVWLKYLSNIIQTNQYFPQIEGELKLPSLISYDRQVTWKLYDQYKIVAKKGEFSQEVEDDATYYLNGIIQYTHFLEDCDKNMEYATIQK